MSRIYDNQPLRNLPLINIEYNGEWCQKSYESGNGILLEGTIQKRSHFAITDTKKLKRHYFIFYIKQELAHKRKFDAKGQEIEPNFSETKKVNTGYLNSSYKTEAKGATDRLSADAARALISRPELVAHTSAHGGSNLLAVWVEESQVAGMEFESGDSVRVKTRGDGPFVLSITKLDVQSSTVSNYAGGEAAGASWTDKIMDMKSQAPTSADNQGADDDEWDD